MKLTSIECLVCGWRLLLMFIKAFGPHSTGKVSPVVSTILDGEAEEGKYLGRGYRAGEGQS